jgi:hypothetical protein
LLVRILCCCYATFFVSPTLQLPPVELLERETETRSSKSSTGGSCSVVGNIGNTTRHRSTGEWWPEVEFARLMMK